jgi:hypothetical protein
MGKLDGKQGFPLDQEPGQASGNASGTQGQEPAGEEPKQFVTLDQFQKAMEELKSTNQGLIDKNAQRIEQRTAAQIEERVQARFQDLTQSLDLQKKMGINITPEQERQLKNQIVMEEFEARPASTPPSGQAAPPVQDAGYNPVEAMAVQILERAGLPEDADLSPYNNLLKNDPAQHTELDYLESVREIAAKYLEDHPQPAPTTRTPTNVGGTGGQSNPVTSTTDPDELWSIAQQQHKI